MIEPAALRRRAIMEAAALGERPREPPQRGLWVSERHQVVERLAALAGHDRAVVRRAIVDLPGAEDNVAALALLREAAERCD
jgi:hypothetical protein